MNKIGLRRIFSLLLAVMMVCAFLPTAAFAEDTAEPQDENGGVAVYADNRVPVNLTISSYSWPFINGNTGAHTEGSYKLTRYVKQSDAGSDNVSGSATARFVGSNETGWTLVVDLVVGNYRETITTNARITNKDMSEATGDVTFGVSFNTQGGISTYIHISGGKDLPKPPQPDKPGKPTEDDIVNNNILGDVTIECTNADVQHGSKSYPLTKESITSITEPVYDSNAGYYSCMVTVSSTSYVHQFDIDKGGKHLPDDKTRGMQLLYYADAWHGPSGDPSVSSILFKVACSEKPEPPKAPDAPSHDELSELIGDITVNCTNDAATHAPKSKGYALIADSYTRGMVVENTDGGYTYAVTIKSEKYVNQFDTDTGAAHTPKDKEATVELEYKDKEQGWTVKSGKPVSFNVACVTETAPDAPKTTDLGDIAVKVTCTTKTAHGTETYQLTHGDFSIGTVAGNATDGYTCTITAKAEKYITIYVGTKGEHTYAGPESKSVTLNWNATTKKWDVPEGTAITFEVKCKDEIVPPTAPTFEELPEIKVTVHCVTTGEHKDATLLLIKDSYEVGKVELKNDVYTCVLTVKAGKYVDEYSGGGYRGGKHELDDDATKDITLTWDGQKWTAEKDSVTFKVKCKLYTVTYTDGVKNKVIFKDELHKDLAYGSDTPKFTGGTPKRTGYTFTGWSPKVADKVTGNVTYVAQWKSNSGKDNVPKTGDGEIAMILGSVLMFSFCGAAAVCVYDRKRRQG